MLDEQAGVGLPLYPPKGARVIRLLQEWLRRDLYARGYEEVITPHIYKSDVWKTSGHYNFYNENMYFFEINEGSDEVPRMQEYGVKPMNCPGHVMLYKTIFIHTVIYPCVCLNLVRYIVMNCRVQYTVCFVLVALLRTMPMYSARVSR